MATFKVGDRVRVKSVNSRARDGHLIGMQGRIVGPDPVGVYRWGARLDGHPRVCYFDDHHLEPLVNPDEEAWQAFKSLHLKPDPALILAKEPA